MILPRLTPPRDPARMYQRSRLQEVSDAECVLANPIAPGASRDLWVVNGIKTCRISSSPGPNREWSGLGQDQSLRRIKPRRMSGTLERPVRRTQVRLARVVVGGTGRAWVVRRFAVNTYLYIPLRGIGYVATQAAFGRSEACKNRRPCDRYQEDAS